MATPKWQVLVSDRLYEEGLDALRANPNVEVVVKTGLSPEQLLAAVAEADALLVRSATKVTAEVIEAGRKLSVIGRAGVGVDNIDVEAATRRGIAVCNSPEGNTVAAAEHTWALLLALARRIPVADSSVKAGEWKRSAFMGVELFNKTLGVVGLGKIGSEVALRAKPFGMRVLGYDPFISAERAARIGVELMELSEVLARSDFITFHLPLTRDTRHLLNAETIKRLKPEARIINCARGGIVDEQAVAEAIKAGRIAGAAFDVFESEPPQGSPLLALGDVVLTPHLGASTAEAQVKVAVDVAQQVIDVLEGRPARNAVNVIPVSPEVLRALEPYMTLAERLGKLQGQLLAGPVASVELIYAGRLADEDTRLLTRSFLKGLLAPVLDIPVNIVNAGLVAESRGLRVIESSSHETMDYVSLITSRVSADGGEQAIAGTLFGRREPRVVRMDQYLVDFSPSGYMLIARHIDKPGMIGRVGTLLGQRNINIAGMNVGRLQTAPGGPSVMVIALDNPVPPNVMDEIRRIDGINTADLVEL